MPSPWVLVVRVASVISLPLVVRVELEFCSDPAKLTVPLALVRLMAPEDWRLLAVSCRLLVLALNSWVPDYVLTVKALAELVVFW